jgi:hypothetical protein
MPLRFAAVAHFSPRAALLSRRDLPATAQDSRGMESRQVAPAAHKPEAPAGLSQGGGRGNVLRGHVAGQSRGSSPGRGGGQEPGRPAAAERRRCRLHLCSQPGDSALHCNGCNDVQRCNDDRPSLSRNCLLGCSCLLLPSSSITDPAALATSPRINALPNGPIRGPVAEAAREGRFS